MYLDTYCKMNSMIEAPTFTFNNNNNIFHITYTHHPALKVTRINSSKKIVIKKVKKE